MRRFTLELSERLGMTAGQLREDMSGYELRERVVLEKMRQSEREKAAKRMR